MDRANGYKIAVEIKTWKKQIEDLYDFETEDVIKENLSLEPLNENIYLAKKGK